MKDIDIKLPRVPNISTWNPDLPSRRHMVSLLPLVDDIDEPVVGGMKGKGGERFVPTATICSQLPDKLAAGYIWQGGRGGYPKATPRESASLMSHKGSFTTPPRNGHTVRDRYHQAQDKGRVGGSKEYWQYHANPITKHPDRILSKLNR